MVMESLHLLKKGSFTNTCKITPVLEEMYTCNSKIPLLLILGHLDP